MTKSTKLEDAFQSPFQQWQQTPTPENASALLTAVEPVLNTAVYSYGGASQSPILRSRAKQLALDAFQSYDPQRGTLKNHLLSHLQRLRRYATQEQHVISLPERVVADQMRLNDEASKFADETGREPSERELSNRLSISPARLKKIRQAGAPVSEGLLGSVDAANAFAPAAQSLAPNTGWQTWAEMVYDDLAPTDQLIMEQSLGLHGHKPQPLHTIAKRLRISPSAVSQRLPLIQKRLDELQTLQGY